METDGRDLGRSLTLGSKPQAAVSLFSAARGSVPVTVPVSQASDQCFDRSMPEREQILSEVERIHASNAFDASERNRAFLRYVVEETLAGRAEYIKGYTVARDVFHRDSDFDPQLDPVVRIEASRLRRSLERYYLTAGKCDRIRVELPKGGYIPRFEVNEDGAPAADPVAAPGIAQALLNAASSPRYTSPSVIVLSFENLSGDLSQNGMARGITEELVGRLTRHDDLVVLAANTVKPVPVGDPLDARRDFTVGYVLKGSVRTCGDRLRIAVQLLDMADGRFLWTEKFDRELTLNDVWQFQEQIAESIATCIAAPDGVIRRLSSDKPGRRVEVTGARG
jgi:adenylate cyclase